MDKMLYVITNTGHIEYVFDNEDERDKKLMQLCEAEKHYYATHYYYGSEDMPIGKYVCEHLCGNYVRLHFTAYMEEIPQRMKMKCAGCPFKRYSRWLEVNESGK